MLLDYQLGQTGIIIRVKIRNSSVTTGAGLTGLTYSSTGLIISTIADVEATATAYTAAASNIQAVATLGTYVAPAAGKVSFSQVDATNHPGIYEVQIANARFAVAGAKSLLVSITGATNAADCDVVIPLRTVNPYNSNFGLAGLAGLTAPTAGALPTVGTGSGQVNPDGTGAVPIAYGTALPASPTANTVGEALFLADCARGRENTAQGGTSNTITLDAGASSAANAYVGDGIILYGGTGGGYPGTGQVRTIVAYNPSTKVATVDRAWTTAPDATSKFITLPTQVGNIVMWNFGAVPAPSQPGVPVTDPHYFAGTASLAAAGYVGVDWAHINAPTTTVALSGTTISAGQQVASVSGAVGSVAGNVGGNVAGSVGSLAAGAITTASFAAGAITSAVMAANCLDSVVIEAGVNLPQAICAIAATTAGTSSGVSAGTPVYNGINTSTPRVSGVASNGNRSSITLNLPAI